MLEKSGNPIFRQVRDGPFATFFPSTEAAYSPKYGAITAKVNMNDQGQALTTGMQLLGQAQAESWNVGVGLVNFKKATLVGDLLSEWLPDVAWMDGDVPAGLFARASFALRSDPVAMEEQMGTAIADVALNLGLTAISAIPVVGQVLNALVRVAMFLVKLFTSPDQEARPLLLPWETYKSGLASNLVDVLTNYHGGGVSWTDIWMPPYDPQVPWIMGQGVDMNGKQIQDGQVFGPFSNNGNGPLAYMDGAMGAIPGTLKVAGHLQRIKDAGRTAPARLQRYFFGNNAAITWGSIMTDIGSFFPDIAQIAGGLWQQANRIGNPDMYKVQPRKVRDAWAKYWEKLFAGAWAMWTKGDWSAGEWLAPYIAVGGNKKNLRLGIPNMRRPHPFPFVTPGMFANGVYFPDRSYNPCLFLEEDLPKQTDAWPFVLNTNGRVPEQHPDLGFRAGQPIDPKGYTAAYWWTADTPTVLGGGPMPACGELLSGQLRPGCPKIPPGYRCIQWPTGQEILSIYRNPADITTPACNHLASMQLKCLQHTLVSAYVRPHDVKGMQRYDAFYDTDLQKQCDDLRMMLLEIGGNEPTAPRFGVILKDVDDIDPDFAQALRDRGVTNSIGQLNAHRLGDLKASASAVDDPDPEFPLPVPPAGGVAFDDIAFPTGPGASSAGPLLLGLALAAGAGYALTR